MKRAWPRPRLFIWLRSQLLLRWRCRTWSHAHCYGVHEAEGEWRFRSDDDLIIACHRSSRGASPGAGQAANERTFAAARKTADKSARAAAAADEARGALALTLKGAAPCAGIDRRTRSVDPQAAQL